MQKNAQRFQSNSSMERVYSPDLLPRLQSLLADLADLDLAFEQERDAIECSSGDECLKRRTLARLWRHLQERRVPYIAALEELEEQARGCVD